MSEWWLIIHFSQLTFYAQIHKMVKHPQIIRRRLADELFECVWPFCGVGP